MIKKSDVLYFEPRFNNKGFRCEGCIAWHSKEQVCGIFTVEDNHAEATDTCGIYIPGPNGLVPIGSSTIDKKTAGFITSGAYGCVNCEYFDFLNLKDGRAPCKKGVADFEGDRVHLLGCCCAFDAEG